MNLGIRYNTTTVKPEIYLTIREVISINDMYVG